MAALEHNTFLIRSYLFFVWSRIYRLRTLWALLLVMGLIHYILFTTHEENFAKQLFIRHASDDIPTVTAVLLVYVRDVETTTKVQIRHLAESYAHIVNEIIVVNSLPTRTLGLNDIADYPLTSPSIQIVNFNINLHDQSRHLACQFAQNDICYFIDDDYLPDKLDLLLANFVRYPGRIHSVTVPDVYWNNMLWAVQDEYIGLHAGFSWYGSGSLISKASSRRLLSILGDSDFSAEEKRIFDSFSSFWVNQFPYQLLHALKPLGDQSNAFSRDPRAKRLISETRIRGLKVMLDSLRDSKESPFISQMKSIPLHQFYVRALSDLEDSLFITNSNIWPDHTLFTPTTHLDESSLRSRLRWIDGDQDLESMNLQHQLGSLDQFKAHSYDKAVDALLDTRWLSTDKIRAGDYIGLHVVKQGPACGLFVISEQLPIGVVLEGSNDGREWLALSEGLDTSQVSLNQFDGKVFVHNFHTKSPLCYSFLRLLAPRDESYPWSVYDISFTNKFKLPLS